MTLAFPKTVQGRTRADERHARTAAEERHRRDVYRLVDRRDGFRCRVCGRRVTPGAIDGRERAEHHHLVKRSQGGPDTLSNVLLLCGRCHEDLHVRAIVQLAGDADGLKDGRLCGVAVARLEPAGWRVTAWV